MVVGSSPTVGDLSATINSISSSSYLFMFCFHYFSRACLNTICFLSDMQQELHEVHVAQLRRPGGFRRTIIHEGPSATDRGISEKYIVNQRSYVCCRHTAKLCVLHKNVLFWHFGHFRFLSNIFVHKIKLAQNCSIMHNPMAISQ